MHWLPLPPRYYSRYSFLLEAESNPGPYCGRKDDISDKFQWQHQKSNSQYPLVVQCLKEQQYFVPPPLLLGTWSLWKVKLSACEKYWDTTDWEYTNTHQTVRPLVFLVGKPASISLPAACLPSHTTDMDCISRTLCFYSATQVIVSCQHTVKSDLSISVAISVALRTSKF